MEDNGNDLAIDSALRITDNLDRLLDIFPNYIRAGLLQHEEDLLNLIEVVLDLGRRCEARFLDRFQFLSERQITREDLQHVTERVGSFGLDNRAGIERTLHRISAIRNRQGDVVGLTCRVGRAVFGTVQVIRDVVESNKSILLLGRPGVGKTTLLREIARIMADDLERRVVIVDTSNEIAGDGDIPHPGIGMSRRMQVPQSDLQHQVMIEAVQNHMPEVIVVDEIGTEAEAYAARTIAERGVTLVATAHGNTLENLIMNPTLSDLVGGIQSVTLGDEEARRRGTQKTVLERRAPPTFDVLIEIQDKRTFAIHEDVATVVDLMLRDELPSPEVRVRLDDGIEVLQQSNLEFLAYGKGLRRQEEGDRHALAPPPPGHEPLEGVRIFPYSVSRNRLERAIKTLGVSAEIVRNQQSADMVLTLKAQARKAASRFSELARRNVPVHTIKSNTVAQIQKFLKEYFALGDLTQEELAVREAEEAIKKVSASGRSIDLAPQKPALRRLQHELAEKQALNSKSVGAEPYRYVRIHK